MRLGDTATTISPNIVQYISVPYMKVRNQKNLAARAPATPDVRPRAYAELEALPCLVLSCRQDTSQARLAGGTGAGAVEVKADHVEDDERVQQRLHRVVYQLHRGLHAGARCWLGNRLAAGDQVPCKVICLQSGISTHRWFMCWATSRVQACGHAAWGAWSVGCQNCWSPCFTSGRGLQAPPHMGRKILTMKS